eukprot:758311-Hanusia_phi.AAC.3
MTPSPSPVTTPHSTFKIFHWSGVRGDFLTVDSIAGVGRPGEAKVPRYGGLRVGGPSIGVPYEQQGWYESQYHIGWGGGRGKLGVGVVRVVGSGPSKVINRFTSTIVPDSNTVVSRESALLTHPSTPPQQVIHIELAWVGGRGEPERPRGHWLLPPGFFPASELMTHAPKKNLVVKSGAGNSGTIRRGP